MLGFCTSILRVKVLRARHEVYRVSLFVASFEQQNRQAFRERLPQQVTALSGYLDIVSSVNQPTRVDIWNAKLIRTVQTVNSNLSTKGISG